MRVREITFHDVRSFRGTQRVSFVDPLSDAVRAVTVLADTSATEFDATNAKGWYWFDVAQAESNADFALFSGKSSTANVVIVAAPIYTSPPNLVTYGAFQAGSLANTALSQLVLCRTEWGVGGRSADRSLVSGMHS